MCFRIYLWRNGLAFSSIRCGCHGSQDCWDKIFLTDYKRRYVVCTRGEGLDKSGICKHEKRQSGRNRLVCRSERRLFLLCFSGRLLCAFCNRFLFFQSWIELVGDEDDAIVLGALLINPFIWLEITLNCQECSLCQLVK